ncbi:hypothetical protein BX600DRAFT_33760 [Xylariales sp. PMI_506]|nr:hypothetical protein BX600DRAFT_33760 [Xylariales sp. PMI_506]
MATAHDSLSEGWEHISGDDASVISLATSDDASTIDTYSDGEHYTHVVPDASSRLRSNISDRNVSGTTLGAGADGSEVHGGSSEKQENKPSTNTESLSRRLSDPLVVTSTTVIGKQSDSSAQLTDTVLGEDFESKTKIPRDVLGEAPYGDYSPDSSAAHQIQVSNPNPESLASTNTALIHVVDDIVTVLTLGVYTGNSEGRLRLEEKCELLRRHLCSLETITKGYAQHWNPEQPGMSVPMDPGLAQWMTRLQGVLLDVKAFVDRYMGTSNSSRSGDRAAIASGLFRHCAQVSELATQIGDFLPILLADYGEFYTSGLPTTTNANRATYQMTNDGYRSDAGVDPTLSRLRAEVYSLKDAVATCFESLTAFIANRPSCENRSAIRHLQLSYGTIKKSLDSILTNHPSDWIDQGLAGGLAYAQFRQIDPVAVSYVREEVQNVSGELKAELGRYRGIAHVDPDFVTDDERALQVPATTLATLKNIEELLVSIFRISK